MADEFGGEIPIGPFAPIGGEEIGRAVVPTLSGHRSPPVLLRSDGVFTVVATAHDAMEAAMGERRPRIGIPGIMQDLYADMIPGMARRKEGYADELAASLAGVGEFI